MSKRLQKAADRGATTSGATFSGSTLHVPVLA